MTLQHFGVTTVALGGLVLVCLPGCTRHPSGSLKEAQVREIYDTLVVSGLSSAAQSQTNKCLDIESSRTSDQTSNVALTRVEARALHYLVSEFSFSCTKRSSATILHRPTSVEIDRLDDVVAWRDSAGDARTKHLKGSIHLAFVGIAGTSLSTEESNAWLFAVALAGLTDFMTSNSLRRRIVVTLGTNARRPRHPEARYPSQILHATEEADAPYRREITVTSDRGPEVPVTAARTPGWFVGWLPAGHEHADGDRRSDYASTYVPTAEHSVRVRGNYRRHSAYVLSSIEQYAIVHAYSLAQTDGRASTDAALRASSELSQVLTALNSVGPHRIWRALVGNLYWLLGILLPILFVAALVSYFLVAIRTRRGAIGE